MNTRFIINQLGLLFAIFGGIIGVVGLWSLVEWRGRGIAAEEASCIALLLGAAISAGLGGACWLTTRSAKTLLGRREALLLVALSWIVGAALAAAPYWLWDHFADVPEHPFASFIDCYFEAVSGLTTTGATILPDIEILPRSLLLWRAMTHWLGGLGIVVLFVAVLPSLGLSGKKLFRVEAPGPSHEGVRPHIRDTARVLWLIYVGMTAAAFLALWAVTPMNWFDSLCHTLSMLSTGGLSTRNASIAAFDSATADLICSLFMLLAGVNFALYYQATKGRWNAVWKDTELRVYLALKVIGILIIVVNIRNIDVFTVAGTEHAAGWWTAIRHGTFVVIAMQTGTGFCTADYGLWPYASDACIFGLMIVGGCAGSTAGGIKVIRFWIVFRVMIGELERAYRPQVVRPLKYGGSSIDPEMKMSCLAFVLGFIVLLTVGAGLIPLLDDDPRAHDPLTTLTASLATLANVGPGLGYVSARDNYAWFSPANKILLSILMTLGRLEFFALLVLMTPRFWRRD